VRKASVDTAGLVSISNPESDVLVGSCLLAQFSLK
jgi:hypothetical protein